MALCLAGSDCEIEEFKLTDSQEIFNSLSCCSLAKLQLGRKSGAMVLAIRDGSKLITNPGGDIEIAPGQLLIALGSKIELKRFRELLGKTLEKVEKINC